MSELPPQKQRILAAFLSWGVGRPMSIAQLKSKMGVEPDKLRNIERRIRELRQQFGYDLVHDKKNDTYTLVCAEPGAVYQTDERTISANLRMVILNRAHSRCAMCGAHTQKDGVKLVIDHRVPISWGGRTDEDNLWAICELCNLQKKNYFESFDPEIMKSCMGYKSVHKRLGELLKAFKGKPVPHTLMEVVGQDEQWQRRARQLRDLPGWDFVVEMDNTQKKKHKYVYRLLSYGPWPDSISRAIKDAAIARKAASAPKQTPKRKK